METDLDPRAIRGATSRAAKASALRDLADHFDGADNGRAARRYRAEARQCDRAAARAAKGALAPFRI